MKKQVWFGSVDLVWLLESIGGWHVGSQEHIEVREAVEYADKQGWLWRRIHYAPLIPEGSIAFELTDKGLEQLEAWGGNAEIAKKMRNWYRETQKYYT